MIKKIYKESDNKKEARKNYLACEKKKEEVIRINAESFKDTTNDWLNNQDNVGKIGYAKKVKAKNGKTYRYNKRTNYFDHGEEENNGAKVIVKNFGGRIKHNFVVNEQKNIRIADYTYTNERLDIFDELIELKTPSGEKHTTIYNRINNSKDQADRFMIDIQKMDMFTDKENIADIEDVMRRKKWIKSIIITKEEKVLKVISR